MMKLLNKIALFFYNIWCVVWFVGIYLVLFPFIYLCIQYKPWNYYAHRLTQLWAHLFFPIIGKPLHVRRDFDPEPHGVYVFVANHFSYLDIAVGMGIFNNWFSYIGKSSVQKIPLLGYMFEKLHIMVNRGDKNSRTTSLMQGIRCLQSGRSVFIMPEGGILSKHIPQMLQPFKDGAFVMAVENQVPIVPITLVNLYKIMPDTTILWGQPRVVIHEPISTKGKTIDDIESLKNEVYQIIQGTINDSIKDAN